MPHDHWSPTARKHCGSLQHGSIKVKFVSKADTPNAGAQLNTSVPFEERNPLRGRTNQRVLNDHPHDGIRTAELRISRAVPGVFGSINPRNKHFNRHLVAQRPSAYVDAKLEARCDGDRGRKLN